MPTTRIALLVTLVAGTLATLAFPYHAVTPGALSAGHERLAADCLACHTPLRGPDRAKCVTCHQADQIGVRFTDGRPRVPAVPRTALVHKALAGAGSQCDSCHGEHSGASRATAGMRFTHDVLPGAIRGDCLSCHADQRPNDAIHANRDTTCSACHGSSAWKPATIDHDRYFRFDRNHPSTCATCHQVASDYKRYTCYGCHEHTPAKMVEEHRDERVTNLDACATCHRSGNEHDTRRDGGAAGAGGEGGQNDGRERRRRGGDDDH